MLYHKLHWGGGRGAKIFTGGPRPLPLVPPPLNRPCRLVVKGFKGVKRKGQVKEGPYYTGLGKRARDEFAGV